EHGNKFQNGLDSKSPTGGVPRPGSGGRWGRNQRHGESRSRFRPRQIILARAAVLLLRAGVRGQPAPESASPLPEAKPAHESPSPFLSEKTLVFGSRLRLGRAKFICVH